MLGSDLIGAGANLRLLLLIVLGLGLVSLLACQAQNSPPPPAGEGASPKATDPASPVTASPLMRDAPRAVFVHFMVSFRSKDYSGQWRGWNYSNQAVRHNPDRRDADGRPDIASVYYPRVGPYDMTDPVLVEQHCQLLKMMGVDGIMFDLGFANRPGEQWNVQAMCIYAAAMNRYGLKAVVIFEDKCNWIWNADIKTRPEAVKAACADLDVWMKIFEPVQYRIGQRPLVGFFSYQHETPDKGVSRLSPEEAKAWADRFPANRRPVLVTQWLGPGYEAVLDGQYDWIRIDGEPPAGSEFRRWSDLDDCKRFKDYMEQQAAANLLSGKERFHLGGAWAGFDDRGCWGWGDGPRGIPREEGQTYAFHWERALAQGFPVIQVASWNDWFEGHNIEPAVEFGYQYVQMTRDYAARHKGVAASTADLRVPEWIYRIRKSTGDKNVLAELTKASGHIERGRFDQAEAIVEPLAEKLKVDAVKYWPPPKR